MHICKFELNGEPMSVFEIAGRKFPAFSGESPYTNKRAYACVVNKGPLPAGTYYIVDRKSGGRLGWLWDAISSHDDWFALYADDGRIDDELFCDGVKRGSFRLHSGRVSKGCITIPNQADFNVIRGILRGMSAYIPRTDIGCYGKVIIK
ncbi:DUF2778 domain-containing protein [Burkholderia guangdongensis]|uniref:DUF2778 domain-containing protein n=1 Tax=Burkholderia guangdongensis TaxID=1792500 RepID=UPI0015CA56E1|nr:DUF2778 domain-containing protein [Burkholderia guangdongensis]